MAREVGRAVLAPTVGRWVPDVQVGVSLAPGQRLGFIVRLDHRVEVRVPAGMDGVARQVLRAGTWVEHGRSLVALKAAAEATPLFREEALSDDDRELTVVRAPTDGTVWLQPEPGEPPYVRAGSLVAERAPLALIEVMKTWSPVRTPSSGIVDRVLVADGQAVEAGQALFAVRVVTVASAAG
ncbi:MAG: biotin/lipoyl-binding protein [Deltaproteobacteria bacterium]|nr:biotin/lipoyl-binding protein [Deltaproteobacteria bacterium]